MTKQFPQNSFCRLERRLRRRDCGAILLLAMIFMLVLALLATTVLHTAVLQLQMSANHQFQEEAYQQARGIITQLSQRRENFAVDGGVGSTSCAIGDQSLGCDLRNLVATHADTLPEGVKSNYRIVRQGPALSNNFPIREAENLVSSADSFTAALFEVEVDIDGSDRKLGSVRLVRGIAVRLWSGP